MTLIKSTGNMYPWVDFMHTHLGGLCPHACKYCYVDSPRWGRPKRYQGQLRLIEEEFKVKYNKPGTYFIEHKNDLFADAVPLEWIRRVIEHCQKWPENTYIFQTKNPNRYHEIDFWPEKIILGCTIESNIYYPKISKAPSPRERYIKLCYLDKRIPLFLTVEPILDFDLSILAQWIIDIKPDFVNIGADSKGHGLPEPTKEKILALIAALKSEGIEVRGKENLGRLLK